MLRSGGGLDDWLGGAAYVGVGSGPNDYVGTVNKAPDAVYAAFASACAEHLTGSEQTQWVARIEQDYQNLRAAFEFRHASWFDEEIYDTGVPILGICYGGQLLARDLGGEVAKTGRGEYGRTSLRRGAAGILLALAGAGLAGSLAHNTNGMRVITRVRFGA